MAVSPRIHWVNLSFLAVLDVLPRGLEEAETYHPAVGLHPRGDRAECTVIAGRNPRDEVRGLTRKSVGAGLLAMQAMRSCR